jgi:hypothetical protein
MVSRTHTYNKIVQINLAKCLLFQENLKKVALVILFMNKNVFITDLMKIIRRILIHTALV